LGQGLDHRGQDIRVEFDRAQPQGIRDTTQALGIEQRTLELVQQALPQAVEPRLHCLGDQILDLLQGVLPDQGVLRHVIPQAPIAQGLATGIHRRDTPLLEQIHEIPLQGPASRRAIAGAIVIAQNEQQPRPVRAIGGRGGGGGQQGLQPTEAFDTACVRGAHGRSIRADIVQEVSYRPVPEAMVTLIPRPGA